MSWSAIAPSNLALIKYMGKLSHPSNSSKSRYKNIQTKPESSFSHYLHIPMELTAHLPSWAEDRFWFENRAVNPSLSYTLPHFVTQVQIKKSSIDRWTPFATNPFKNQTLYQSSHQLDLDFTLSEKEQTRFITFFKFLKSFFKIPGQYEISSQNNFPQSTGIASSASSFCALTFAAYKLAQEKSLLDKKNFQLITKQVLANLSRAGSGSSCRSFFSPWCIWSNYKIYLFSNSFERLEHQLILIDSGQKKISSSLAHQKVKTSPQFKGRPERAEKRMSALKSALSLGDWKNCFKISREEFLDMHSLFESSQPPFSYQNKTSRQVIDLIDSFWKKRGDGPLMTMDAGANIHLLYRRNQKELKLELKKELSQLKFLSSKA